jgi:hypothetical protein
MASFNSMAQAVALGILLPNTLDSPESHRWHKGGAIEVRVFHFDPKIFLLLI